MHIAAIEDWRWHWPENEAMRSPVCASLYELAKLYGKYVYCLLP